MEPYCFWMKQTKNETIFKTWNLYILKKNADFMIILCFVPFSNILVLVSSSVCHSISGILLPARSESI